MFNNQQVQKRQYPFPAETVFKALCDSVSSGLKIKSKDDVAKTVNFSSGASAFTWGENFTATVFTDNGGSAVSISGVGKVGGQVMQSTKTNKIIDQVFNKISDVLKNVQVAVKPEMARAQGSLADQIKELTELFDSGVLTQEEFTAAKKKILE